MLEHLVLGIRFVVWNQVMWCKGGTVGLKAVDECTMKTSCRYLHCPFCYPPFSAVDRGIKFLLWGLYLRSFYQHSICLCICELHLWGCDIARWRCGFAEWICGFSQLDLVVACHLTGIQISAPPMGPLQSTLEHKRWWFRRGLWRIWIDDQSLNGKKITSFHTCVL